MPTTYKRAVPYAQDALNLPVPDVESAVPFYERIMGFHVIERKSVPQRAAMLGRDDVRIGLAENGGDPTQEGCFFEVDDVEAAFAELRANGLNQDDAAFRVDRTATRRIASFSSWRPMACAIASASVNRERHPGRHARAWSERCAEAPSMPEGRADTRGRSGAKSMDGVEHSATLECVMARHQSARANLSQIVDVGQSASVT